MSTEDQDTTGRDQQVGDLKQACLDLSREALALFDRFDEHGTEAAWKGDGVLVVVRMERAHEELRSFLGRQATARMMALGVSSEALARMVETRRRNRS